MVTNGDGLQTDLQSGNAAVLLTAPARQHLERDLVLPLQHSFRVRRFALNRQMHSCYHLIGGRKG